MICVCAQIRKDGHMEENAQKFLEKMNELVALGKKKKSIMNPLPIKHFSLFPPSNTLACIVIFYNAPPMLKKERSDTAGLQKQGGSGVAARGGNAAP